MLVEKNVKAARAIILAMALNTFSFVLAEAESPNVTGSWKVEITFANEQQRFLRLIRNQPVELLPPVDSMEPLWNDLERAAVESKLSAANVG